MRSILLGPPQGVSCMCMQIFVTEPQNLLRHVSGRVEVVQDEAKMFPPPGCRFVHVRIDERSASRQLCIRQFAPPAHRTPMVSGSIQGTNHGLLATGQLQLLHDVSSSTEALAPSTLDKGDDGCFLLRTQKLLAPAARVCRGGCPCPAKGGGVALLADPPHRIHHGVPARVPAVGGTHLLTDRGPRQFLNMPQMPRLGRLKGG